MKVGPPAVAICFGAVPNDPAGGAAIGPAGMPVLELTPFGSTVKVCVVVVVVVGAWLTAGIPPPPPLQAVSKNMLETKKLAEQRKRIIILTPKIWWYGF